MSFEPTFTLLSLQHGESKKEKQYKCNLCVLDFKKHTTLSVAPDSYWNLKRHINSKHSDEKENFEEMCEKNRRDSYFMRSKEGKLLLLKQNSLKHQTQEEYQKHQEVKQDIINVNRNTYVRFEFYLEFIPHLGGI